MSNPPKRRSPFQSRQTHGSSKHRSVCSVVYLDTSYPDARGVEFSCFEEATSIRLPGTSPRASDRTGDTLNKGLRGWSKTSNRDQKKIGNGSTTGRVRERYRHLSKRKVVGQRTSDEKIFTGEGEN